MRKILNTLIALSLFFCFTSCGPKGPTLFTVTYETKVGTAPEAIEVEDGTVLSADELKPLTAANYTFLGWFDGETEAKADEYAVTKDVTLTAKWDPYLWQGTQAITWQDNVEIEGWAETFSDSNALKITYTTTGTNPVIRIMDKKNWKMNYPEYVTGDGSLIKKIDTGAEINDIGFILNKENGVITIAFAKETMDILAEKGVKIMGQDFTITKIAPAKLEYTLTPDVVVWEGEEILAWDANINIPAEKITADTKGLRVYLNANPGDNNVCFDYPNWERVVITSVTGNGVLFEKDSDSTPWSSLEPTDDKKYAALNYSEEPASGILNCYFTEEVISKMGTDGVNLHGHGNPKVTKVTLIK